MFMKYVQWLDIPQISWGGANPGRRWLYAHAVP